MTLAARIVERFPQLAPACAAAGVPLGLAVGWIAKESGGRLDDASPLGEEGLFQVGAAEARALGLDPGRLARDADYSIAGGLRLARYCAALVGRATQAVEPGSEVWWAAVKFVHSLGEGAGPIVLRDADVAGALTDWPWFVAWLRPRDDAYRARFGGHSPLRWAVFVGEVLDVGRPYGLTSVIAPPVGRPGGE